MFVVNVLDVVYCGSLVVGCVVDMMMEIGYSLLKIVDIMGIIEGIVF